MTRLLGMMLFLASCVEPEETDPRSPDPSLWHRVSDDTGHVSGEETSDTSEPVAPDTSVRECLEDSVYHRGGQLLPADEGWSFANRQCTVTAPPPACEERHLGVLQPPPEGAAPCSCDFDCPVDSFCGAGHCRPRDGELLTICIEEIWYEGEGATPPIGQLLLYEPYGSTEESSFALWTPGGQTCRLVARRCEQFRPTTLAVRSNFAWYPIREDECRRGTGTTVLGGAHDPYGLPFSAHANRGCFPFDQGREGTLWLSVWYP